MKFAVAVLSFFAAINVTEASLTNLRSIRPPVPELVEVPVTGGVFPTIPGVEGP